MLIQVLNLPSGTTVDEIRDLFCSMKIIDSIHVNYAYDPDHTVAWVGLSCSQAGANAISESLDGRYFKGRHVSTYTSLFLH
jgi:hypothetical protein